MNAGTMLKTAWWLQVTGQVITAWTLVLALVRVKGFDPMAATFILAFYGLALWLPMKSSGSIRDRAITCMAAAAVMASALSMQLLGMLFTLRISSIGLFTLLAMVLFTVSGSLFWLNRETD